MKREGQRKPFPLHPDHDLAHDGTAVLAIAKAAHADKEDLKRRIVNFLVTRNRPGLRQIDVEVQDGVVFLRGSVRSYYDKQLAAHCCGRVAGVHQIVDDIRVTGSEEAGAWAFDGPGENALSLGLNFGHQR